MQIQSQPINQQQYKALFDQQSQVLKELRAIKEKLDRVDLLREFDAISSDLRAFAKAKGIKPADVLKDD